MSLDKATVAKIAHLARIKVPDEELEALAGELSQILTFVDQLNEVDTTDVPPMTSVAAQKLRRRKDAVTDGGYAAQVLSNGPETVEGFYVVPKVVE
ncbi:Asp-tRNA(Asn)/Glu-tRNA(Gln) amidotransferase subunit GatC [Azospirillum sp.]|jgi:aspartyl-tRNA(Asn)/glutamyl-tRNA(Gln) amidotransferase subunit C|uniref:Asp-tRNA(Asn)/Glu-tRNA(Gln) amidotransferase subunit GatC n=1 Tax=Azospirillum sp. TaxID=34012 RepID=UPI00261DCA21|nr:Asp-tRNA(Asn)/Glu-tRNA(Gln) amidotransferase subunit GatC [Azospirillum sp.]